MIDKVNLTSEFVKPAHNFDAFVYVIGVKGNPVLDGPVCSLLSRAFSLKLFNVGDLT